VFGNARHGKDEPQRRQCRVGLLKKAITAQDKKERR